MIDFIQGKRNIMLALAIMFVVVSLSGTTYSLFFNSEVTNNFTYTTGLLDLQINEDKQIVLSNAFPTIDSEGMKTKPYELTITNTGNVPYLFDLKMLSTTEENVIDNKYIKVMVDDNLPATLYTSSGIIVSNDIIYPEETKTYEIRVWLDYNTPNQELGKTFISKIAAIGESTYKTLDNSNANRPELLQGMIPVSYNSNTNTWQKTSENNLIEDNLWYDYNNSVWANVVMVKDSKKQIYDITGKNHIQIEKIKSNNRNAIIGDEYLDLKVSYNENIISNILRIKFDDLKEEKIYIISNDRVSYYYDNNLSKFVLKIGNNIVSSSTYKIEKNKWYIIGYTYDGEKVSYYIDGNKISTSTISDSIITKSTFKLGTNEKNNKISKITIGDVYIYNRILSPEEIATNYKTSISIIYDSLVAGYNEFYPMTLNEYYQSAKEGQTINLSDVTSFYVWIPRFKYKVWNVTGKPSTDIYDAQNKGIEISFEEDTLSSGTIYCQKGICYSDNLMITKVTETDNGKYYTHPAFTTENGELSGFWVSKYEISNNNIIENKPGNTIITNQTPSLLQKQIKNINSNNNYHMIKNTEWGAITYLSHSKYGICKSLKCQPIQGNQTYISGNNPQDSTTGNEFGVYDMSGGASEFVMGIYSNELGNTSLDSVINQKEIDLYYPNTFILGDATLETTLTENSWNSGISNFINETNNWFIRGGIAEVESSSIYSYRASSDNASEYITTRITIN